MDLHKTRCLGLTIFFLGLFAILFPKMLYAKLILEDIPPTFGMSVASGYGVVGIVPIRVGVQRSFGKEWAPAGCWPISGYLEASGYQMRGKKHPVAGSHRNLQAGALAAVLRILTKDCYGVFYPYLDLGFGASILSRREISGRKLGILFQFEDRLSVGVRFGEKKQYDIAYRAVHLSNAYLGQENHGINLHLLVLGYWFH